MRPDVTPWECTAPKIFERDQVLNLIGDSHVLLSGGLAIAETEVAANYNADETDTIIGVDSSAGTFAVTLMTANVQAGRVYIIKDTGNNANIQNITVNTEGLETIDGAATAVINTAYGFIKVYCDGTNWFLIG